MFLDLPEAQPSIMDAFGGKRRSSLLSAMLRLPLSVLLAIQIAAPVHAQSRGALAIVRKGLSAQGGEATIRGMTSLRWHATGYRNELEQSERPEGPWIIESDVIDQVEDLAHDRIRSLTKASVVPFPAFETGYLADGTAAARLNGNAASPGNERLLVEAKEALALSPERLLLTALGARDLRVRPRSVLQGVPQDVLTFTLDDAPVTIFLNSFTHLPTAVDFSGPLARSGYWAFTGDVTMRTYFGYWWLAKNGVKYPLQRNTERNGRPDSVLTNDKLVIDGSLSERELAISAELRRQFDRSPDAGSLDAMPLGDPKRPPFEIAPGIMIIPGRWNVTVVRQSDGLVIIEAPISSGYSAKVIEAARRRYPGLPIKAVVTTSDSWPHLAGIREYVARRIPIYCLDLNEPILGRTATASYATKPDLQQRLPRKPRFHPVTTRVIIGTGENRMQLYPISGETSERQMMVWFPARSLLYGSDPFQRGDSGKYFYPQTVDELRSAMSREGLTPTRFFMMHVLPTPWDELARVVANARQQQSPGGSSL